ncbi:hypothetical protein [uncultured Clostridium sp.]|uniref:hypothetical protein n=1 Tax=uncultured Clostridium sp. TaxID=59620 RepID=UPI0028E42DB7|nr:hypothetical protein [uncultured Clostridium sp.]
MDNKEIDEMFFKIYGQEKLAEEYKDIARNSNAYAGLKTYIKLEELMGKILDKIEKLIKK